ncbi:MAG: sigma-70 family RNA polymerase sigma factor [Pirellulaceae bacterium]|nr:sigma-70 family RNA polymerase sigma factor [Pirellulaceae bacterium]
MSKSLSDLTGSTSATLIARMKRREPDAWRKLSEVYTPLVYGWARRGGLGDADAADVVQEVFRSVYSHADDFDTEGQRSSFRSWLWAITRNQISLFYRRRGVTVQASGGMEAGRRLSEYPDWIDNEEEPSDGSERRALLERVLAVIRGDFDATTWQAFWRLTVEKHSAAEISGDLGISQGAVRQAKYRVLCRLRQEMGN